MLNRNTINFVRAVIGIQRELRCTLEIAKKVAAVMLGDGVRPAPIPKDGEFAAALAMNQRSRARGRPRSDSLPKSEAVAAVACYFESIGAAREQSITEAKRWLNVSLSRRVAKQAVDTFRQNTSPEQFKVQAGWAFQTYRPGTTQMLPTIIRKVRKKRRVAISDLG